ncbi:MAG: radical SAM protein [Cellvibrionales bacterium]|nr:radical SAM protein [Cellvibrionales bacterium]
MRKSDLALLKLLDGDTDYLRRYSRLRDISKSVRVSEYLITNACNIRCKGCWFFEYDFDKQSKEVTSLEKLEAFLLKERQRGINTALVIGGEPTLFPKRVKLFTEIMDNVTVSTNGLSKMPFKGFEDVAVLISLFGGGKLDDELRAIKPNKSTFKGLFDKALQNYKNDHRACFIFAITEDGIDYIEETVEKIQKNGNRVSFNFYSKYDAKEPLYQKNRDALLEEALRVKSLYPDTVLSHPYYIRSIVTGKTHWDQFSYDVCPSVSVDHPDNQARVNNGNPVLPGFNAWAADLETINLCCTSGHCDNCQDSQAVFSWLLMSMAKFRSSPEELKTWIEIAESYWAQFSWISRFDQGVDMSHSLAKSAQKTLITSDAVC